MTVKEVASHTPTPWHRNIAPATKYPTIWSGRNTHVARVVTDGLAPEEVEGNVAFIVRACNSHAELCKVLDRVLDSPSEPDKWHQDVRFALRNADGKERKPSLAIERLTQIKASEVGQLKASNRELLAALEALLADLNSEPGLYEGLRPTTIAQAEAAIQKAKP